MEVVIQAGLSVSEKLEVRREGRQVVAKREAKWELRIKATNDTDAFFTVSGVTARKRVE